MRILVTGGAGFIGSNLAEGLLRAGHRVRVLDNLSTGKKENLAQVVSQIEFVEGDLRDERKLTESVRGIDYVFHLAAVRAVLRSVDDPLETNDVNIGGTLKLLLASKKAGVKRFIFSSSSAVYGETEKFPSHEDDRFKPASPYAVSKAAGEYYCRIFSDLYGLETVSLRYFNVFGPHQNPESKYSTVIPIFIESLLKKTPPEIHWDGRQSRDFLYVDNVVYTNLCAMKAEGISGEVFNIGSRQEFSVLDILEHLQAILNVHDVKPVFAPKRSGDVRRTLADITKAERRLGYRIQTPFRAGLEKTVRWFLESGIVSPTGQSSAADRKS